jgi:general secretion pathway protein M
MMNFWTNLNERERWIVAIGVFFALLYIFYLAIYSPLTSAVSNRSNQLKEKKETLAWMQQVRQKPHGKKVQETISSSKLLTVIATQLNTRPFQKFPFQLQQTGLGDIQLTFDKAPYTIFLTWVWNLSNDYSITLKQLTIERTDTEGVVKVMVVISAS